MKLRRSLAGVLACAMLLPGSAGMLTLDADAAEQEIQVQQEAQQKTAAQVYDLGQDIFAPVKDNGDTGDHTHGSTIVELEDGELIAAWFQGNGERDGTTTRIMAARKPAGGQS